MLCALVWGRHSISALCASEMNAEIVIAVNYKENKVPQRVLKEIVYNVFSTPSYVIGSPAYRFICQSRK